MCLQLAAEPGSLIQVELALKARRLGRIQASWVLPQFQRAVKARLCVSGRSLHESPLKAEGLGRPLYELVEVKPGFQ